jgi:transcription factor SFP1
MQESSQSPPPSLYYSPSVSDDRGRESSTSESTPLSTPTVAEAPWPAPAKRERDLYFSWHKKQDTPKRNSNPVLGSDWHFAPDPCEPLFEDEGDHAFPLFPDSPPTFEKRKMATSAVPIDISLPPRLSSSQSPRNQTSNLTSALQEAGAAGQHVPDFNNIQHMGVPDPGRLSVSGRHDSISNMFGSSYYGSGARPISMKDRQRRESNTGGSFMGGMSWGGISVGSLRDEYDLREIVFEGYTNLCAVS